MLEYTLIRFLTDVIEALNSFCTAPSEFTNRALSGCRRMGPGLPLHLSILHCWPTLIDLGPRRDEPCWHIGFHPGKSNPRGRLQGFVRVGQVSQRGNKWKYSIFCLAARAKRGRESKQTGQPGPRNSSRPEEQLNHKKSTLQELEQQSTHNISRNRPQLRAIPTKTGRNAHFFHSASRPSHRNHPTSPPTKWLPEEAPPAAPSNTPPNSPAHPPTLSLPLKPSAKSSKPRATTSTPSLLPLRKPTWSSSPRASAQRYG